MDEAKMWRMTGTISRILAGLITKKVLVAGWTRLAGNEPPATPLAARTTWLQAVTWAAASGAALGVARLVIERGAAEGWKVATGSYPKNLEEVRP